MLKLEPGLRATRVPGGNVQVRGLRVLVCVGWSAAVALERACQQSLHASGLRATRVPGAVTPKKLGGPPAAERGQNISPPNHPLAHLVFAA